MNAIFIALSDAQQALLAWKEAETRKAMAELNYNFWDHQPNPDDKHLRHAQEVLAGCAREVSVRRRIYADKEEKLLTFNEQD